MKKFIGAIVILAVAYAVLWGGWWCVGKFGGEEMSFYITGLILGGLVSGIAGIIAYAKMNSQCAAACRQRDAFRTDAERYQRNKALGAKLRG